jgi:YidC/Oxa1 family membrane protein insertase
VFDFLIVAPLTNLVIGFYQLLGQNLGLAIILFTVFLRIVLLPLTIRQIKQQKKMAQLQPRLQELQSQRKDASQMSPEEVALMKQTAGSCLGGCLPLLIQIPILLGLNHVIGKISSNPSGDVFNHLLYFDALKHDAAYHFNTMFLGFDLAGVPSKIGFNTATFLPYGLLMVLLVVTQYFQSKLMMLVQKKKAPAKKQTKNKPNEKKKVVNTKDADKVQMQEEMQKMMQMQTTYLIPVMIGMASYSFSAALSIYWLTQNVFAIGQMFVQNKMSDDSTPSTPAPKEKVTSVKEEDVETIREAEFTDAEQEKSSALTKSAKKSKKSKKKKSKK